MAIASAVQRGEYVYIYDARGVQIGNIAAGSGGKLIGYTSSSISIQRGNIVYVYDEKGRQISNTYI